MAREDDNDDNNIDIGRAVLKVTAATTMPRGRLETPLFAMRQAANRLRDRGRSGGGGGGGGGDCVLDDEDVEQGQQQQGRRGRRPKRRSPPRRSPSESSTTSSSSSGSSSNGHRKNATVIMALISVLGLAAGVSFVAVGITAAQKTQIGTAHLCHLSWKYFLVLFAPDILYLKAPPPSLFLSFFVRCVYP